MVKNSLRVYTVILIISSVFMTGCLGGRKTPNLEAIFAQTKLQKGKRPVIIIPGILGSELDDPATEQRAWFSFGPIKGDNLALPISPDLTKNRDTLVAKRIIEKTKVFALLPEISIYQSLIDSMEKYGGYTAGDWDDPGENANRDKYYVFAYDWRLDNTTNAQLLMEKIDNLKKKIGDPNLRFNVIAHSMGGLIARYAAMYGKADLPANGAKPVPTWIGGRNFNKIFMFGTPNEGSMDALKILLDGYRVGGFDVGSLSTEVAITSPAVFQLLPHQRTAKFYDENLKLIDVDLYNPETWKKYRWSAYTSQTFLENFADKNMTTPGASKSDTDGFKKEYGEATREDVDLYFAAVLKRAQEFHAALDADSSVPASVGFFAFGSDCQPTLDGAIIYKDVKTGELKTTFSPKTIKLENGTKIKKEAMRDVLFAPGDGRVTRRSLLAETISDQNYRNSIFRKNLPVSATFFCEAHDELPNSKIVQDNFITALISEITQ